ncbi:alpha/beta hydrolase [Taibaiella lutea]|uniref:Alpha/beta hydrolase n=1 Tax=Taibaiella lutea TaxID=2608001 RepID=A0A5M6CTD6_9BACT|nr:alpha/beta hydrolase [Taibaiella lutea]KAA5536429.1 alpha/beta hydrolase [Taibaiella lutea]
MTENHFKSSYAAINGLNMYYEIHGQGKPLVLIHGGGSTIETTFGRIIPLLAKNRQVIAMELQAHGHTNDRDTGLSFEQDAYDVAALLHHLKIEHADFLGFSNGGQTMIAMALRHPHLIRKMILASIFYKRSAVHPQFWNGFDGVTVEQLPQVLKEGYLKANNDEAGLLNMFNRDVQRMKNFKGWTDEQMQSIAMPTLVINGNQDVGSLEHAVEICRNISYSELAVFPGGHGTYLGAIESVDDGKLPAFNAAPLIETFLDKA